MLDLLGTIWTYRWKTCKQGKIIWTWTKYIYIVHIHRYLIVSGPHLWRDLFPEACSGKYQSPINIHRENTVYNSDLREFAIWYDPPRPGSHLRVLNNGHTGKSRHSSVLFMGQHPAETDGINNGLIGPCQDNMNINLKSDQWLHNRTEILRWEIMYTQNIHVRKVFWYICCEL